jgi:hypothetical protein
MMAGMMVIGLWPSFHPRVLAPRGVAEVPDGYRELRVMSFNVWLWNRDQDAIRNQIELQDFGNGSVPVKAFCTRELIPPEQECGILCVRCCSTRRPAMRSVGYMLRSVVSALLPT